MTLNKRTRPRHQASILALHPSTAPFRQYLDRATAYKSLLPPWWTPEKIEECVTFGESGAWSDVRKKVTKHEVTQHYGYEKMPGVQPRMLFDKEDETLER
jgi:splicing suppressor protein 51